MLIVRSRYREQRNGRMKTPAENKQRANETRANKKGGVLFYSFLFLFYPSSGIPPSSLLLEKEPCAGSSPVLPPTNQHRHPSPFHGGPSGPLPPPRPFLPCGALPAHSLVNGPAPPGWVPFPTGMVPLGNVLVKKKKLKKKKNVIDLDAKFRCDRSVAILAQVLLHLHHCGAVHLSQPNRSNEPTG